MYRYFIYRQKQSVIENNTYWKRKPNCTYFHKNFITTMGFGSFDVSHNYEIRNSRELSHQIASRWNSVCVIPSIAQLPSGLTIDTRLNSPPYYNQAYYIRNTWWKGFRSEASPCTVISSLRINSSPAYSRHALSTSVTIWTNLLFFSNGMRKEISHYTKPTTKILTFYWPCILVYLSQCLTNLMHKICFTVSFISCLYMFRTRARNM